MFSPARYDLAAVGNAIVDVLSESNDAFIKSQAEHGMIKGTMQLIDAGRASDLYAAMGPAVETSGGSAANTMAAFAALGGSGAFIGKVAEDQLGQSFTHDMHALGVTFDTSPLLMGAPTARCLILVTPDAERTMNTFLGASVELDPQDIDTEIIAGAGITYLEGYLFDKDRAKQAFAKAATIARESGRKVALSLSDTFCVERHFNDFHDLIDSHVDILFANEEEIMRLYETPDIEEIIGKLKTRCDIGIITRSGQGSIIVTPEERIDVDAVKPAQLVDSTGAGDAYAAGFLFGLTRGKPLAECGHLGALVASEVISHMGPRPQSSLQSLLDKAA